MLKWTLVQHSGFGYGGDRQFARAVENASVDTKRDLGAVIKVGGVLFDTYQESSDAEYKENYPNPDMGITPFCRGSFAKSKIDGLKIYIPSKEKKK